MSNEQVVRLKEWRSTHPAPKRNWRAKLRAEKDLKRQAFVEEFKALTSVPSPGPVKWQRQCREVDAETGKRCSLLEHGFERLHNASDRVFRNPLAVGAQPRRDIDRYALQQLEAVLPEAGTIGGRNPGLVAEAQLRYREKKKAERTADAVLP